ncbi:MAG TPA: hypothetical protein PKE26_13425 [Kiritimatiellia bacterium]|nr:hypothetical protein [Kiritimatiellia bacterium]
MDRWGIRLLFLAVALVAAAGFFALRRAEAPMLMHPTLQRPSFMEPDALVRWRLVDRALAGEGVRIRWIDDDNAPVGRINEWTAPTTLLGYGFARLLMMSGMPVELASRQAGHILSAVTGILALWLLGILGWKAGGPWLGIAWMVAWPALEDVLVITRFGNPDHHALHQLLFIGMIGGVLAGSMAPRRWSALCAGMCGGLGLWSAGSELLPAWGLVAALMAVQLGIQSPAPEMRRWWRVWWIAGLLTASVAWLWEFWPSPFHRRLEMLSFWHVSVLALSGLAAEMLPGKKPAVRAGIGVLTGAVVLVIALALRGWNPSDLHVVQDVRFQRQMMITREFQPLWQSWPDVIESLPTQYGWLPLLALVPVARLRREPDGTTWLLVVVGGFLVLTLQQLRWADFFVVALVMSAGIGALRLAGRRAWIAPLLMAAATAQLWSGPLAIARNVARAQSDSRLGPHLEIFTLEAIAACLGDPVRRPIVLAPWDGGSALAGAGTVRVIGSAYWSNLDGIQDSAAAFATESPETFDALIRRREADYLVLPPPERLAVAISQAWRLTHGIPPTWEELTNSVVWKLSQRRGGRHAVRCPAADNLQAGWVIVDLRAARHSAK